MEQPQILHTGTACRECSMLNVQCDRMVPFGTYGRRGLQSRCPDEQLPGTNEMHTLGGLKQQNSAIYGHVQPLEHRPGHAPSLSTRETYPLLGGHRMNYAQQLQSTLSTQSSRHHAPLLENNHHRGYTPMIPANSYPIVGMNTNRLQREDLSDEAILAFETGYNSSLSRTYSVPETHDSASYEYTSDLVALLYPSLQPNQSGYQATPTRSELPFDNFTAPWYRHSEATSLISQGHPQSTGSSLGLEIERETPYVSSPVLLSGRAVPLPLEVNVTANRSAPASIVAGLETAPGGSNVSHTDPGNPLPDGQMSEGGIYSQRRGSASSKELAQTPASCGTKSGHAHARIRARPIIDRDHYPYRDDKLRSKYPEQRQDALELAIKFQQQHGHIKAIPSDLLDDLLEQGKNGKYLCFCCPEPRKARTITPARDHVRKSLGNFPFRCNNAWCTHSSLRQADLNKHMRTCMNQIAELNRLT